MASLPFDELTAAAERWSPVMLDLAARGAAALGLAWCGALAMRRASAAARHRVWLLGFVGVMLLPVLSAMLPGWRVLPRREAAETTQWEVVATAGPVAGPVAEPPEATGGVFGVGEAGPAEPTAH